VWERCGLFLALPPSQGLLGFSVLMLAQFRDEEPLAVV